MAHKRERKKKCLGWCNAIQYRSLCNFTLRSRKKKKKPTERTNLKRISFFAYVFMVPMITRKHTTKNVCTACFATLKSTDNMLDSKCDSALGMEKTHPIRIRTTECILHAFGQQCEHARTVRTAASSPM